MGQLENLLAERDKAQAAYEEGVKRMTAAERELKEVQAQRAKAKKSNNFDEYISLGEDEQRLNQKFQLLAGEEKRRGMEFAEIDKRHNDLRQEILGLHSSLKRYDLQVFPSIEARIKKLENQIKQEQGQLEGEKRKRQALLDKIATLTDLTEDDLKKPNPIHPMIGKYNRRGTIIARM